MPKPSTPLGNNTYGHSLDTSKGGFPLKARAILYQATLAVIAVTKRITITNIKI
jgi:hypothetical protein